MILIHEFLAEDVHVHLTDPFASPNEVAHEYKLAMVDKISDDYDAVIVAVAHDEYKTLDTDYFKSIMKKNPILVDLKGLYKPDSQGLTYWKM